MQVAAIQRHFSTSPDPNCVHAWYGADVTESPVRRGPGRPSDPKRQQQILDAARRLFFERGFHGVTVNEIGRAAGATGASLYRHFESKEDVLLALMDEVQDRYLAGLPTRQDDPWEELDSLLDELVELTVENRELAGVWSREARLLDEARFRRYRRRERIYFDRWTECVRRCRPDLSDDDGARVARALIEMVTLLIAGSPRVVDERELELVRSILRTGLRVAPS